MGNAISEQLISNFLPSLHSLRHFPTLGIAYKLQEYSQNCTVITPLIQRNKEKEPISGNMKLRTNF